MSDDKKKNKAHEEKIDEEESSKSEREEVAERISDIENKYKRALADYQNLEKRVRDEKQQWVKIANKGLILELLSVLDTLLLVAKHFPDKSLELAIQQFLSVLQSNGVKKIKTEKEQFDPEKMECITTQDGEEGKVLEELRTGYIMNDVVIRPAQVVVGKKE